MKVVMITGSAGGIGKAAAERFLTSKQWKVVLCDVNESMLFSTAEEFGNKYGSENVIAAVMDVSNRGSVDKAVEQALKEFGQIDCLINNAGITRDGLMIRMKEEDFDRVININLKGVFNCTQGVLKHMFSRQTGSIINTSSVVALYGNVGQSNYVATKAAVIGLTKTWSKEFGKRGIRVNAVAPGFIMTEMVKTVPEKIMAPLKEKTPLDRFGEPSDVANAYYFLASDEAAYITGHVLSVDGGLIF